MAEDDFPKAHRAPARLSRKQRVAGLIDLLREAPQKLEGDALRKRQDFLGRQIDFENKSIRNRDRHSRSLRRERKAGRNFMRIMMDAVQRFKSQRKGEPKFPAATRKQRFGRGLFDGLSFPEQTRAVKMKPETFFLGIREQMANQFPIDNPNRSDAFNKRGNSLEGFLKGEMNFSEGRKKTAHVLRRLLKNQPLDAPQLMVDVGRGTTRHEGRHRVAVANLLGIKEVPAEIGFTKNVRVPDYLDFEINEPLDIGREDMQMKGSKDLKKQLKKDRRNQVRLLNRESDPLFPANKRKDSVFRRIMRTLGTGKAAGLLMGLAPGADDLVDAFIKFPKKAREHQIRQRSGS